MRVLLDFQEGSFTLVMDYTHLFAPWFFLGETSPVAQTQLLRHLWFLGQML